MTESYSKAEIDAKLETAAARAETGRVGLDGKLDRVLDGLKEMKADFVTLQTRVHDDAKTTTYSIWGLAIALLAILLGLIGFLITNQGTMTTANGNVLAAVGAGREQGAEAITSAAPPPKFDAQTGKPIRP